jgi:hypothetical protein
MVRTVDGAPEDFDATYAADARRLLRGEPPIDRYRGPLYPLLLAAATILAPGFSLLRIGVWISAVAAAGLIPLGFFALRPLVGARAAILAAVATAITPPFLRCATREGIDMFFAFLCVASLAAMAQASRGAEWAAAAGALGGLALDTRWNAVFLPAAAAVYFIGARRYRRLAPYGAGLLVTWVPWLAFNWAQNGSPFRNLNYLNVAYAMYGRRDGSDWHAFFDRIAVYGDPYGSLEAVVLGDPGLFLSRWLSRIGEHASRLDSMAGWLAWLAPVGLLFLLGGPGRGRRAAQLAPPVFALLINATYMYVDRLNLVAIPFVLGCAAYSVVRMTAAVRLPGSVVVVVWIVLTMAVARDPLRQALEANAAEARYVAWAERFLEARPAKALVGDWDGDGMDGVGTYTRGEFMLRQTASSGPPDYVAVVWAMSIDLPLAARAYPSRAEKPALHRQGLWVLPGMKFGFGYGLDQPLLGDWDGDERYEPGTYDGQTFHLARVAPPRVPRAETEFDVADEHGRPQAGGIAVAGDWDGDDTDTVGLFHDGRWSLYAANAWGPPAWQFALGEAGDVPVVGDWDGDGIDSVGVFRAGEWILTNVHASGGGELPFRFP